MMKKILILLILFSVTIIISGCIGLMVFPDPGETYGFICGGLLLLTLLILADKIILGSMHAKSVNVPHLVKEQVSNHACRFGLGKIHVYSSQRFSNNIYFANSILGKPSIIIGDNLYRQLKKDELEVLIVAALWYIDSGEAGYRTICSLILSIYRLPMILIPKRKLYSQSRITSLISFFIFPLSLIKFWIFNAKSSQILSDHQIFKMGASEEAYSSVIYKLSLLNEVKVGAFSSSIVQNLAIADNKSNEMMNVLSSLGMTPEEKYSDIMTN